MMVIPEHYIERAACGIVGCTQPAQKSGHEGRGGGVALGRVTQMEGSDEEHSPADGVESASDEPGIPEPATVADSQAETLAGAAWAITRPPARTKKRSVRVA